MIPPKTRAVQEYANALMRNRSHAVQHRTENGKPCAVCACGWRTDAETYGQRREDIWQHFDATRATLTKATES